MQLVKFNELLAPSVCVVCESTPTAGVVVDTLQRIPGFTKLSGRKYVCERCVAEFAALLDYEQGTKVKEAQWERDQARKEVANIRNRIDEFAKTLGEVVNHPGATDASTFVAKFGAPDFNTVEVKATPVTLPPGGSVSSSIGSAKVEANGSPGPKK